MRCIKCKSDFEDSIFKSSDYEVCKDCIDDFINKPVIFNEVLAYVNTFRSAGTNAKLKESCVLNFIDTELEEAKKLLLDKFRCLTNPADRRGSIIRTKSEFLIKDILDFFEVLDGNNISVTCAAVNIVRLPAHKPEETNIISILDRLVDIENKLNVHGKNITDNKHTLCVHEKNIGENINAIGKLDNDFKEQKKTAIVIEQSISKKVAVDIVKK